LQKFSSLLRVDVETIFFIVYDEDLKLFSEMEGLRATKLDGEGYIGYNQPEDGSGL
jgi:hypothetical protein